jgi:hypothetical protein
MFKLMHVFIPKTPAVANNSLCSFAVGAPKGLLPILHKRLLSVTINKLWGAYQVHNLTHDELLDLDVLVARYYLDPDAYNMLLDGRELSLLTRFLTLERLHLNQLRRPVLETLSNSEYWSLLTDLLLATKQPTRLVKLSFLG